MRASTGLKMADTKKEVLQVRAILEDIVREARELYQHIKNRPDVTSATKKRVLNIHSTILAKTLDKLDDLSRADMIMNQGSQAVETSSFIDEFLTHRAKVVAE